MAFKKCKYCDGENISFFEEKGDYVCGKGYVKEFSVWCNKCKNHTDKYLSKDTAYNVWNAENSQEE